MLFRSVGGVGAPIGRAPVSACSGRRRRGRRYGPEEEERRQNLEKRREQYYGQTTSTPHKRRPNIFIFKQEDLDNEDIILAVESTPTAHRSRKSLDHICHISIGDEADSTPASEAENNGNSNKIVF